MKTDYLNLVMHYESCFEKHGDTFEGVDWPNKKDAAKRYQIMEESLSLTASKTILDFGCGLAHFHDYLKTKNRDDLDYSGLELSPKMVEFCRKKKPDINFYEVDVIQEGWRLPIFDYTIMNGVFTEKLEMHHDEMFEYFKKLVKVVFDNSRHGVSFNVMSAQVDWERQDLFHLSLDQMAWFIKDELSRKFIVRNDYGLYEYTVCVLK